VIVEVLGDVPNPGVHLLNNRAPTVSDALTAAGWDASSTRIIPAAIAQKALESGERLRVSRNSKAVTEVVVEKMDGATGLALGFKLDLNAASEQDLLLVPLMKPEWARAIVERRRHEPWHSLDELDEIHGVGPKTVEKWRPHLDAVPPPP
jgi:competence protein ComEA